MKGYIEIPKEPHRRQLHRFLSDKLLKFVSTYQFGEQFDFIRTIRSYARHTQKVRWDNSVPSEASLHLDTISIPIFLTYEEWLRVQSRLRKLFVEFPHKDGFLRTSLKDVNERIQKITDSSVQVRSWSPIGYIQFSEKHHIFGTTKIVKIDVISFFKGHIGIVFTCLTGPTLDKEIENLLRAHFYPDIYLQVPPLKRILKSWGMSAGNGTTYKQAVLKEKINIAKNDLLKFFGNYLGLDTQNSRILIPSLDIWHFKSGGLKNPWLQEFWYSLNHTPRSFAYYRAERGKFSLSLPELRNFDASVKIVANLDRIKGEGGEEGSVHTARQTLEFFRTDFSLLWRYYFHHYQLVEATGHEMLRAVQNSGFWNLRNFKLRNHLLKTEFRLDALEKDFDLDFHHREIDSNFLNCESLRKRTKTRLEDELRNGISFQKKKLDGLIQSLRKFLDNSVETRIAHINLLTQILVLILGFVTVYDQSEKTRAAISSLWGSLFSWITSLL